MNQPARPPIVTLLLVTGNLLAAFALLFNPDLANQYGFRSNAPSLVSFFTSLFLHGNILHLLGNMLFLAAVGSAVETATGWFRYLVVYFLSGFAGLLLHFVLTKDLGNQVPYLGASGAVAGLIGYYVLRYQAIRVPVVPRLALPILAITLVWLALQIIGAFVRLGDVAGTAYWAHLGGFGMGVLLSGVFRTPDAGQLAFAHQTVQNMSVRGPGAVKIAAERHLKSHPKDVPMWHELAEAAFQLADNPLEVTCQQRIVELGTKDERAVALKRLLEMHRLSALPIRDRVRYAETLAPDEPALAIALLESAAEDAEGTYRAEVLLALAHHSYETDRAAADRALQTLQADYPLEAATDVARKRGWLD